MESRTCSREGASIDDDVPASPSDAPRHSKRATAQRARIEILSSFAAPNDVEKATVVRDDSSELRTTSRSLQRTTGAPNSVLHHPPQAGSHGCRRWVFRQNPLQLIGVVHHAVHTQIRSSPADPDTSTTGQQAPSAHPSHRPNPSHAGSTIPTLIAPTRRSGGDAPAAPSPTTIQAPTRSRAKQPARSSRRSTSVSSAHPRQHSTTSMPAATPFSVHGRSAPFAHHAHKQLMPIMWASYDPTIHPAPSEQLPPTAPKSGINQQPWPTYTHLRSKPQFLPLCKHFKIINGRQDSPKMRLSGQRGRAYEEGIQTETLRKQRITE
ncbi:hypothetical protein ACLOJK_004292 [Asimina triloba]